MRPSPARKSAPIPESWIPIESLFSLPEVEELLNPSNLVDSGQTRAVRMDSQGNGYVLADPDVEVALKHEKREARKRSHMRWSSKRRTLHLKRRAKVQKILFTVLTVALSLSLFSGATSFIKNSPSEASSLASPSPMQSFIPAKVDLVIEGEPVQVLSFADSMDELIVEQNLTGLVPMQGKFERANFTQKRSAPAMEFRYPKIISVNVDSINKKILVNDLTVKDVLASSSISIDGDDVVNVPLDTPAKGVGQISITRVSTTSRVAEEAISFETIRQNDALIAKGKTIVKQVGKNGTARVTYIQTIQNGSLSSEVVSSKEIIKAPVNKIISVGTKPLGLESGKASWYAHIPGTCAHKSLPMGTIITVRNSNNGATTSCRVADRGPFGAGRIVDLSKDVFAKIASVSQGVVSVTISW